MRDARAGSKRGRAGRAYPRLGDPVWLRRRHLEDGASIAVTRESLRCARSFPRYPGPICTVILTGDVIQKLQ